MDHTLAPDASLPERAADLCAHEPATFAAVEQFVEQLQQDGVAPDAALSRALEALGR